MAQTTGSNRFEKWEETDLVSKTITDSNNNLQKIDNKLDSLQQNAEKVQVINLPLTSIATRWDADFAGPQVIKEGNGIVHLRGVLKLTGSFTNGDVIAILPEGFRPPVRDLFSITAPGQIGRIDIEPTGKIHLVVSDPAGLNWFYISGVSFSTY